MPVFVTFEGLDGVGKTTLMNGVAREFIAHEESVETVDEFLNSFLDGALLSLLRREPYLKLHSHYDTPFSETLLLLSSHAYKFETAIRPALARGASVLVDRYVDSVEAYQLPGLVAAGMPPDDAIRWVRAAASSLPTPDIIVFVDAPEEEMAARRAARGDDTGLEDRNFLSTVARNYEALLGRSRTTVIRFSNNGPLDSSISTLANLLRGAVMK